MKSAKINVCIADDHRLVRQGIATLLSNFDRIGEIYEAEHGQAALEVVREMHPHVVLLDLQMPGMSGLDVCKIIVRDHPDIRVLILSMNDEPEVVELLIRYGAHGFLSKGADGEEVMRAVYDVNDHGRYTNDLVLDALRCGSEGSIRPDAPLLTQRELEVLRLICAELTMREIGQRLNISEKTVQNHRSNIMQKLSVSNTAGLVKWAISNPVVDLNIV
jgi:two-component system, NarL family, response regulator DegU